MSTHEPSLPQQYASVTLIQYPDSQSHATGFFYGNKNGNFYLITNKHVVDPEDEELQEIRILLRQSRDLAQLEYKDIQLIDHSGGENWLEHPSDPEADVAAIPLDVDLTQYGNLAFSRDVFLPDDVRIGAGQQAMILGHPFKGNRPYIPVARSALISSPYGVAFQGMNCFATDANMHSGTSGSPVLTIPSSIQQTEDGISLMGGKATYLLGVHSATLHSNHEPEEGPLNLNLSWYAELIEDIVASQ